MDACDLLYKCGDCVLPSIFQIPEYLHAQNQIKITSLNQYKLGL